MPGPYGHWQNICQVHIGPTKNTIFIAGGTEMIRDYMKKRLTDFEKLIDYVLGEK